MPTYLRKLANWQAILIIVLLGAAVFLRSIHNPFMGDDSLQVVNNPVIHSLSNIRLFFEKRRYLL